MKLILLIALIAFATVAFGQQNVIQIIQTNTLFSVLSANITANAPGLATTLGSTTANFSYIAPTNTGMGLLNTLNNTGLYPSYNATLYYAAAAFPFQSPLPLDSNYTTLFGSNVRVNNYTSPFNTIITFNGVANGGSFAATNGIVYQIGSVLYPPLGDAVTGIARLSAYTEFANLIVRSSASAKSFLTAAQTTIFAPNNTAMFNFNTSLIAGGTSLALLNQSQIDNLILNHILNVPAAVFSAAIPTSLLNQPTKFGTNQLNFSTNAGSVLINFTGNLSSTATVVNPNIVILGGVVHGVDRVLYPAGFIVPAPSTTTGSTTTGSTTTGSTTTGSTTTGSTTSSASSFYISYVLLVISIIAYFF